MLQTLMISFREGLEAFLIIAISLIYLSQTNRRALIPAVYYGVFVALILSIGLGVVMAHIGAMSPLAEGWLAILAAVSVIYCTVHMMRMGKFMKQEITTAFDKTRDQSDNKKWIAAFLFSAFMVGREGVETATMIASLTMQTSTLSLAVGAFLGIVLAALLAWAWVRFGKKVNLHRFFQVTSVFMVIFSIQLLFYAFHEFSEVGALPLNNEYWHNVTENWSPEGIYGRWFSYSLGIIPLGWLIYVWLKDRKQITLSPAR